jgi:hypothetical protein
MGETEPEDCKHLFLVTFGHGAHDDTHKMQVCCPGRCIRDAPSRWNGHKVLYGNVVGPSGLAPAPQPSAAPQQPLNAAAGAAAAARAASAPGQTVARPAPAATAAPVPAAAPTRAVPSATGALTAAVH